MEKITFNNDITVLYVTAASFPEGILAAHQELHSKIPFSTSRKYFGLSPPEHGTIVYRAAAEQLNSDEGKALSGNTMVIRKGTYISLTVHNYMKDLQTIERAFKKLLSYPGLDPQGYCVEWYLSDKDVNCMIRLADGN